MDVLKELKDGLDEVEAELAALTSKEDYEKRQAADAEASLIEFLNQARAAGGRDKREGGGEGLPPHWSRGGRSRSGVCPPRAPCIRLPV